MVYHPVDFDIDDFLSRIQGNKPPFVCPADTCRKTCKSYAYMQKHMLIHRPPAPIDIPVPVVSDSIGRANLQTALSDVSKTVNSSMDPSHPKLITPNMYSDPKNFVMFDAKTSNAQSFRCNIFVPLTLRIESNSVVANQSTEKNENVHDSVMTTETLHSTNNLRKSQSFNRSKMSKSKNKFRNKYNRSLTHPSLPNDPHNPDQTYGLKSNQLNVPKPVFSIDPDFPIRKPVHIKEGSGYIRFIEKSTDELDEIVEYDLDEEDLFWLEHINENRQTNALPPVNEETLEWVIDRFEKKSRFRFMLEALETMSDNAPSHSGIDEDAVCAVCQDGTCENTNVILFCDVCNLAVHQECYGVPYVPEGLWLCRKCLHSPSEPVSCVLCPNREGAFKKTTDDRWAHVICGLWVPEVMFANLTFLEPLEGIDRIAPARWRLQCFICKQRNAGACIQCHKTSCYRAFHVTCAQHAGLYMKIEHTDDPGDAGIRKSAFCDQHCPPDHFTSSNKGMYAHSDNESPQSPEEAARAQLRKARKVLAERRKSKPSVCVPIVPKAKIELIVSRLTGVAGDKMEFIKKAYLFWKLKREFRRGVPLLKRLQGSSIHRNAASFAVAATTGDAESQQMRAQLKFWQQLRQDLEKARLLSELTRKRERIKCDIFQTHCSEFELRTQSLVALQLRLLDQLQELDKQQFFAEPVGPDLAPDYSLIIKTPMDFSTMRQKVTHWAYATVDELAEDFHLMLDNCYEYNRADSIYCIAATKLRDQGSVLIAEAIELAKESGFCPKTGFLLDDAFPSSNLDLKTPSNFIPPEVKDEPPTSTSSVPQSILESKPVPCTTSISQTGQTFRSHLSPIPLPTSAGPLKELVNGLPSNSSSSLSVATSTRSRLRSFRSPPLTPTTPTACDMMLPSGDGENHVITSTCVRKRRYSSLSSDGKTPKSGTTRKSTKQPRIHLASPISNGFKRSPNTCTNLFAEHALNPKMADQTSKWINNASSSNNRSFLSTNSRQTSDLNGVIQPCRGPAFTRYRSTRLSRADDEDDDDDDDEETDESDEEDDSDQSYFTYSVPFSNTTDQANIATNNAQRRNLKLSKLESQPGAISVTTLVGSSRMACASKRSKLKRKPILSKLGKFSKKSSSKLFKLRKPHRRTRSRNQNRNHDAEPIEASHISPKPVYDNILSKYMNAASQRIDTSVLDESTASISLGNSDPKTLSLITESSDSASPLDSCGPLSAATSLEPFELGLTGTSQHHVRSPLSKVSSRGSLGDDSFNLQPHHFCPLDVVWAKWRGYPWYPALIVDPNAREGYSHNGVPIPVPPQSVLSLGKNMMAGKPSEEDESLLLVLFFDTKRTWQWLSPHKIQPLGSNKELDQERLREGRRSKTKHSVVKAYRRAVEHMCKVHGRPYPYSDGRSNELVIFAL